MHSRLKWLYPGMRVKRWLVVMALGVIFVGVGTSLSMGVEIFVLLQRRLVQPLALALGALPQQIYRPLGLVVLGLGCVLIGVGYRQTIRSLVSAILPQDLSKLPDILFERRQLKRGPRVVVVGGGTGLSTLLRGVKAYTSNVTAIVTTADDGGSSGRLRNELGIPPPGDIRNTLVALADTEPLMERLFQYRFEEGDLRGHSFGNLFIAAMTEVTGDFEEAVRESSKVLAIRGRVLPSTLEQVSLRATYDDGSVAVGESKIPVQGKRIARIELVPKDVGPLDEALEAIHNADAIILGPGSLFTSILPNLLVRGVADAVRSAKATKIYVCNVMTQRGETDGYRASDHLRVLAEHAGDGLVEYAVLNSAAVPEDVLARYASEGSHPVECDADAVRAMGIHPIVEDLIDDTDLARHDPHKLARTLMEIMSQTHPDLRWQAGQQERPGRPEAP